jgi:isopenicillin N synthase-like dioxygenase
MPRASEFENIPPFPDDVPTAPLVCLSFEKLLKHDNEEVHRFCDACEGLGFFYLDLCDVEMGNSILSVADRLFPVGEQLLALDLAEKMKYDFSKENSYFGYKAMGSSLLTKSGKLDKNEFYNVR